MTLFTNVAFCNHLIGMPEMYFLQYYI